MRSTLVLRLMIFGGCLMLGVRKCSSICRTNQYTITWGNDSVKQCLNCEKCHAGHGLKPTCGKHIRYPPEDIGCVLCLDGETFSDEYNSAPCSSCHKCAQHEIVAANCTIKSDTKCSGMCIQGYYFSQKPRNDCQKCSYCCFDGKDEIQPECVTQGLNASSQHCSPRVDRNCGPDPTTMKNLNTQPTNVVVTNPSSVNNVIIALGTVSGVLLSALVIVSVLCIRRRKAQTRREEHGRTSRHENGAAEFHAEGQGQEAQHTPVAVHFPRTQALKNEGFMSNSQSATPEVSPAGTPYDTEDELDSLPDVKARNPKILRQKSKEAQNEVDWDHNRRQRSGSLQMAFEAVQRKLSSPKSIDYQPLPGENPDELQGSIEIEEHPMNQTHKEGSRVELKCEVKHNKNVTFQWLFDGTKIQGQVNSTLVLDSVKLRDFGWYKCEVKTTNGRPCQVESRPVALDVTPRDGMKLKLLTDVFKDSFDVQEKVQKLLSKNIDGVGRCKRIAAKYKMDVSELDGGNSAGESVLSYLGAKFPYLTAYDFCKTLKEPEIGRLDIVKELLDHLSLPQERTA